MGKDLLSLPAPFPEAHRGQRFHTRSVCRRVGARQSWKGRANDAVSSMSELAGLPAAMAVAPSACQSAAAAMISEAVSSLAKPSEGLSAAGAFHELCGSRVPYLSEGGG